MRRNLRLMMDSAAITQCAKQKLRLIIALAGAVEPRSGEARKCVAKTMLTPKLKGNRSLFEFVFGLLAMITVTVVVLASSSSSVVLSSGDDGDEDEAYSIGLWGDVPYSDLQALTGVPNLIDDMNSQHLAFSVHNGDLKGGRGTPGSVTPTTCVDALYVQAVNFFNALQAPAMFTPGDNDWTDCDSASNGGFNSLERLDHERQVFFSTPFSLGQRHKRQEVQTAPLCLGFGGSYVPCVENRRWTVGKVVYVTLNIQGSCNNLCDTNPDPAEYADRNAANIVWLNESFDRAESTGAAAIMIISQANPVWNVADATTGGLARNPQTLVISGVPPELDGFKDFLIALRTRVIAFRKPVAYVHGDSHYPRIDKPFLDAQGRRLENFTRVETFGDNSANGNNDVNWTKVMVDPRSREVFSYQLEIVPTNRTAVQSP